MLHHFIWSSSVSLYLVPASRNEYQSIRLQLESEDVPPLQPGDTPRTFHQLPAAEQASMEKKRLAGKLLAYIYIHKMII